MPEHRHKLPSPHGKIEVLVDGMDTADEAMKYEIRKTVGMVFQNPDNQIAVSYTHLDVYKRQR